MEDICSDIFQENRSSIKIKKKRIGVKNLSNIFEATLKLSNKKGFKTMSLRDLCKETGLSMGALYSYFKNKDELLNIIQQKGRLMVEKVLRENIEDINDSKKKLETAIYSHLYLSEIMQPWFFFSYMETRHFHKDEHKKGIESELYTEQIFIDILEQGKKENIFFVENTVLTASVIKAMLQDWYLKHGKYIRRKIKVEEYASFIVKLILAYIAANPLNK
ncbi:MAG: TetR/AcrR family transcriptional regulator [Desulfobacterales bacterium]|nr:TetR/AcrR family transcriptional regulator [Desulfobacterales bacterium]MBF0395590.1 TetR/AcrR family transcriptional regulator [Desulfobacterales bacterium]